ncbi:MAG TPA: hypothetical protein VNO30_38860 [Kofleriaceae bacterium]|nr:hypothetical protein [Kofleriaceae bacterium]
MTTAFREWRKMPRAARDELRGSEDYLTSRTVGMLRFLGPETLARLLRSLEIEVGRGPIEVVLWPREQDCEPDATIASDTAFVLVEAKFKGSQLGEYATQLGREWRVVQGRRGLGAGHLLLITDDRVLPEVPAVVAGPADKVVLGGGRVSVAQQIQQYCAIRRHPVPSPDELDATIRWCSWAQLHVHCTALVPDATTPAERVTLLEILASLERLDCLPFQGWSTELPALPSPPARVHFSAPQAATARKLWTSELPAITGTYHSSWM